MRMMPVMAVMSVLLPPELGCAADRVRRKMLLWFHNCCRLDVAAVSGNLYRFLRRDRVFVVAAG